jgi:hypothetical protein
MSVFQQLYDSEINFSVSCFWMAVFTCGWVTRSMDSSRKRALRHGMISSRGSGRRRCCTTLKAGSLRRQLHRCEDLAWQRRRRELVVGAATDDWLRAKRTTKPRREVRSQITDCGEESRQDRRQWPKESAQGAPPLERATHARYDGERRRRRRTELLFSIVEKETKSHWSPGVSLLMICHFQACPI